MSVLVHGRGDAGDAGRSGDSGAEAQEGAAPTRDAGRGGRAGGSRPTGRRTEERASSEPAVETERIGSSMAGAGRRVYFDYPTEFGSSLSTHRRRFFSSGRGSWTFATLVVAVAVGVTAYLVVTRPSHSDSAFVRSAYEHLLARPADPKGLAMWDARIAHGTSRTQIAYDILVSPEYRADLVDSYFKAYLAHPADATALGVWVGQMNTGTGDQAVQEGILGSPEYYSDSGSTPGGFVTDVYEKLLGRHPDKAELSSFETQLSSGGARSAVAAEVLDSNEYRTDFVKAYYHYLLGRAPDTTDLDHSVSMLTGGASCESVIAQIVGSNAFSDLAG